MSEGKHASDAPARPRLIVWCADARAGAPALAALGDGFDIDLRAALPSADDLSGTRDGVVLLYLSPAETLRRAMADEIAPADALENWRRQARALLDLNRRDRRRIRLADIDMALRHPVGFRACFNLPDAVGPEAEPAPQADDILRLLARRALLGDPAGRALSGELEAASVRFGDDDADNDAPDAAFQAHRGLTREAHVLRQQNRTMQDEIAALSASNDTLAETAQTAGDGERRARERVAQLQSQAAQLEADLARMQDEAAQAARRAQMQVDLLQAQNRTMQDELEMLARQRQQAEARLDQLNQGLDRYQSQIGDLRARQAGLVQKMAGKEHSLQTAGRMLGDLETRSAELQDQVTRARQGRAATQRQLAATEARLERILASRSYRLTAPLRRMRALISGGKRT